MVGDIKGYLVKIVPNPFVTLDMNIISTIPTAYLDYNCMQMISASLCFGTGRYDRKSFKRHNFRLSGVECGSAESFFAADCCNLQAPILV